MERLKRNPAAWGMILGGAIAMVGSLFAWVTVTNTQSGSETRVTAFDAVGTQTLFLTAVVLVLFGGAVLMSSGKGRIFWALLGLIAAGVILAAGLMGIFAPETLTIRFVKSQAFAGSIGGTSVPTTDQVQAAFDAGTLTAKMGLGAIFGVVGGALGVIGSVLSFGKPRQPV